MSAIKFRKCLTKFKITIALPKKFGSKGFITVVLLSFCCVFMILSSIVITLMGRGRLLLCMSLICGLCTVCYGLITLPLAIIGENRL